MLRRRHAVRSIRSVVAVRSLPDEAVQAHTDIGCELFRTVPAASRKHKDEMLAAPGTAHNSPRPQP